MHCICPFAQAFNNMTTLLTDEDVNDVTLIIHAEGISAQRCYNRPTGEEVGLLIVDGGHKGQSGDCDIVSSQDHLRSDLYKSVADAVNLGDIDMATWHEVQDSLFPEQTAAAEILEAWTSTRPYFAHSDQYPAACALVERLMMHGPCGDLNCRSLCMQGGACSKRFPKQFSDETNMSDIETTTIMPIKMVLGWIIDGWCLTIYFCVPNMMLISM
ncbi:hypothetical protein INT45_012946 [Circinella minor]|uniref:Uncharacterized protein n=1 Tax=Circinella minor TaxID=1195481 RepID=A0A8H7VNI7_9FUNG|nr:hypothetical protein INT45_012946 [Circinella minor]